MSVSILPSDYPLLAIIGPSGAGKSTTIEQLVEQGLISITPTWTDRPRRDGEKSLEHHFVTPTEFDTRVADGMFAHTPITLFGLPYRYASPRIYTPENGSIPATMTRSMAIGLLDKLYPHRIIYQIEADYEQVAERLSKRYKNTTELGTRLTQYHDELENGRRVAQRCFINDASLEKLVNDITVSLSIDYAYVAETVDLRYTAE